MYIRAHVLLIAESDGEGGLRTPSAHQEQCGISASAVELDVLPFSGTEIYCGGGRWARGRGLICYTRYATEAYTAIWG